MTQRRKSSRCSGANRFGRLGREQPALALEDLDQIIGDRADFASSDEIVRVGCDYLRIVGPIYGFYGLGMALFFATQGFGSAVLGVIANAIRLLLSAGGALIAIYWFGFGATGFYVAVAIGFVSYAAVTAWAVIRVQEPSLAPAAAQRPLAAAGGTQRRRAPVWALFFASR